MSTRSEFVTLKGELETNNEKCCLAFNENDKLFAISSGSNIKV